MHLVSFDIDCARVGFDGKTVWAHPKAIFSYMKGYIMLVSPRSPVNYIKRLHKYAERGWPVKLPVKKLTIQPYIEDNTLQCLEHVVAVLMLKHEARKSRFSHFAHVLGQYEPNDDPADAQFYTTSFIPFGEKVSAKEALNTITSVKRRWNHASGSFFQLAALNPNFSKNGKDGETNRKPLVAQDKGKFNDCALYKHHKWEMYGKLNI
jgi:hypothetical protein